MQQVSTKETEIILEELEKALPVFGDIVEFGCYKGGTSVAMQRILVKAAPEKTLWLYDSFAGLPERTRDDASVAGDAFKAGELFVTKREVVERFKKAGLRVPRIRKGFFEELDSSAESKDLPERISFAFLDGDLYQSIKTSLALVTPRMAEGGVILVHDYNNPQLPGVTKAVDEWAKTYGKTEIKRRETLAIIS